MTTPVTIHQVPTQPLTGSRPAPLPLRELLPWVVFGGLLFAILVYFVSTDQGASSLFGGSFVHEFVHDARHLLGFPCH